MKVILDLNVLISAARTPGGTCDKVIERLLAQDSIFISQKIMEEYNKTSTKKKHSSCFYYLLDIIQFVSKKANFVDPLPTSSRLPDTKDQIYLETALAAEADVIITGNGKHFPEDLCAPVRVLSPGKFLEEARS